VPGLDEAERTLILSGTAGRLLRIAA
jgi:hypothetical protein